MSGFAVHLLVSSSCCRPHTSSPPSDCGQTGVPTELMTVAAADICASMKIAPDNKSLKPSPWVTLGKSGLTSERHRRCSAAVGGAA
jgi:hypothetical protein